MDIIWTAILGLIQGATEFLPVSSSGHLAAAQMFLENQAQANQLSQNPLMLEIMLHLATLFAVIVFYRRDVADAIKGFFRGLNGMVRGRLPALLREDDGANLAMAVIAGTIPTGVLGLLLRHPAEAVAVSPVNLGMAFLGTAFLLLATIWWKGGARRLSLGIAIVIGVAQGIAVLPGLSRSGTTIAVGLALGLRREEAVKFSFLLSLPAIIGAALLELNAEALSDWANLPAYLAGMAVAFFVGLIALYLLVRLVRSGRFWVFAPYVFAVGLGSILFL